MRKFPSIFLALVIMSLAFPAFASPTLPVDGRKIPMQFYRDFSFQEVAPSDTTWTRINLPEGTVAVHCLSIVDSVAVSPDSTYATGYTGLPITKQYPLILPTVRRPVLWVRRAAAGTASKVRLIFYKM